MRAGTIGAFVIVLGAAVVTQVLGVLVAAVLSGKTVQQAGDALMWLGAGQLVSVAVFVAAFRWLALQWGGAAPSWWAQALLAVLLLVASACLFLMAVIGMNR